VVLCDRFLDSTYVYQSILGGVGKDCIDQVTEPLLGSLLPTWTFVLSLDPSVAWERMQATRAKNQDRYDTSPHHPTIQDGFLRIVQEDWPYPGGQPPKRIAIDASRSPEVIHAEIWDQVFGV
jgi:dTMP kinase